MPNYEHDDSFTTRATRTAHWKDKAGGVLFSIRVTHFIRFGETSCFHPNQARGKDCPLENWIPL